MAQLVTAQMSISLDGFYAGTPQEDLPSNDMATWMHGTEAAGFFRITRWAVDTMAWREHQGITGGHHDVNSEIIAESFATNGAYVMGRRMFDGGENPWGEEPPFRAPVFVVTNREREPLERVGTTFSFVTDGVESAVKQARAAAGEKNVGVTGGGKLLAAVLEAGLLERLDLHIVPVILGQGLRLLGPGLSLDGRSGIELTPEQVTATPTVTHIRYAVGAPTPLVLDKRGRE